MLSGGVTAEAVSVSRVYGDITGDNLFDIKDISAMAQYIASGDEAEEIQNIDFNSDDNVDIMDFMIMKRSILEYETGIRFGFPICDKEHTEYYSDGIDVSKWQGIVDWEAVKASGIEFVMIKAGEGIEEEINFRQNIEGALNAGLQCGVYWFANASTVEEALLEAEACLKTIEGYQLEYPVAYDFEYRTLDNNPAKDNPQLISEIINEFLTYIQKNGYYPIVYSNLDFLQNYLDQSLLKDFDLWYASYKTELNYECAIWQHSCTGRIDGITENVDLDISYINYPEIIKKYGWNGF